MNCKKLVKHVNECFTTIYRTKYPDVKDFLPIQVMYRCHILARCLLIFELFAIMAPDELRVDPFDLIRSRGCFLFNSYCGPDGFACEELPVFNLHYSTSCERNWPIKNENVKKVTEGWIRF